jgi:hypothetical protein
MDYVARDEGGEYYIHSPPIIQNDTALHETKTMLN